jgi:GNAT superfamily N-acetyltransferase
MEIRELNENDLPSLLKLYEQLDSGNGDFAIESAREIWKNEIAGNPNIKYFGAVENTADGPKVLSTCFCTIIPNLTRLGGAICFVENVVTDKDYRKQGLGKKVMKKTIEFAREKKCYKVILESGAWRTEAHQFYRNLGFDDGAKKSFLLKLKDY